MPAPRTPVRSAARPATRPVVDAREAQALREAMALRQLAAARPDLTPAQLAAARAALAAKAGTRPAGKRPAGKRPTAKRHTTERSPARTGAAATERAGSRWSSRLGVVALGTLLVPALITVVLPGTTTPSGGPLDVTALALTARSSLLEAADGYRALEQTAAHRRDQLAEARAAEQSARDAVDSVQQVVGTGAADLYRATPTARYPVPSLDASFAAGALAQELAADADQAREASVVRAERSAAALADAEARVDRAEAVAADAEQELATALERMRAEVDDLSTEVTGRLASLGTIPAAGQQQERNQRAVARWQGYLAQLTGAGVEPPAAADIVDPTDLPAGLSPALDADGNPVPGVAWAVSGSSPVTVLPSETVAAVSNALSQLGKPFVAGSTGPETYDCGGFTAASWLLGGYALPATPQQQWATGTAVPLDGLEMGDLVFSPGGQDVGIYLGDGDVLGASAATYQVGIRSVAAGSTAVRVPVAATGTPNAALPAGGPTGPCGAPLATPGGNSPRWGGWDNGEIPTEALCRLGVYRHALRCDAAAGYAAMGEAYEAEFGTGLCITDSYRSLASQVDAFSRKPALAAVPGTSNHGWALAVDLCGGIHRSGSEQWRWMTANAGRFGFVQPDWAAPGGEKPEPWHWEFGYIS
ncbi:Cell wall-associated hydrolase, NlpC family [Blastococcus aurantiacus]|uniref:Cell wall-associated hydrolase, NlpC family n=1 Tax=Blastococcus aurantiacus TaxID=1550231 RepID=A0A1G7JJZ5_9ACTN|nr:NlpC/P60 family protein [Blastococcus aurantiacus]SDF25248.1 Cell wall-associated hydrolase, NlpC family [Blastococcus aurantiacus]